MNSKSTRDIIALLCSYVYLAILILKKITHVAFLCPGCHFPCLKCRSNKCGNECRQNRKWMFESVELDGKPNSVKNNPYAKDLQIPPTKKQMKFEALLFDLNAADSDGKTPMELCRK